MMKSLFTVSLALVVCLSGCKRSATATASKSTYGGSLLEARKGFKTKLVREESANEPLPTAPPNLFRTVKYTSPAGELGAYLSPDPRDGKKHPAIIWITGGDCNTIGDVWSPAPAKDDQSASAYRKAGIVMMFPSLRGGNQNPGVKEGFLGEVDDVLAAANYLTSQPYVDPNRIYLGGHSSGGTLALLTAECSGRFRAVFSFGPADDIANYPADLIPFDVGIDKEIALRSPRHWLGAIKSPTFIIEGYDGNAEALQNLETNNRNPLVKCVLINNGDHFNILGPANEIIARAIVGDTGPTCNINVSADDIGQNVVP